MTDAIDDARLILRRYPARDAHLPDDAERFDLDEPLHLKTIDKAGSLGITEPFLFALLSL